MEKTSESLKKHRDTYLKDLEIAIKFGFSEQRINEILDRLNELQEMILELEKEGK